MVYSNASTSQQELESKFCLLLDTVALTRQRPSGVQEDSTWTQDIKERTCELGHELGYDVSAWGCEAGYRHHWLVDFTASPGQREDAENFSIVMLVECSQDKDDISWDFSHLLLMKANLKLFVYQQTNRNSLVNLTAALERWIWTFRMKTPGETYLLAGYSCADGCFDYITVAV